jgi:hypothetical protein
MLGRLFNLILAVVWLIAWPIWVPIAFLDILGWVITGRDKTVAWILDKPLDYSVARWFD